MQYIKRKYSARQEGFHWKFMREYHVPNGKTMTQACKKAFLSMFAVLDTRITSAFKAQSVAGGSSHAKKRGRHDSKTIVISQGRTIQSNLISYHLSAYQNCTHFTKRKVPKIIKSSNECTEKFSNIPMQVYMYTQSHTHTHTRTHTHTHTQHA